MTNNEINIAIAELSGWYPHPDNDKRKQKFWTHGGGGYGLPNGCVKRMAANPPVHDGSWEDVPSLPDYCNDLNAMHEAMKTLSEEQVEKVWETLCDMIPINPHSFRNGLVFDVSARVRAEAFLRVIGKWKE